MPEADRAPLRAVRFISPGVYRVFGSMELSPRAREYLEALSRLGGMAQLKDIAAEVGATPHRAWLMLKKLIGLGLVKRIKHGVYGLAKP